MRRTPLRQLVVNCDTREKKGHCLLLPDALTCWVKRRPYVVPVKRVDKKLFAGDYSCPTSTTGIERKGSIRELHTNLFANDRSRALAAFRAFGQVFEVPVLLVHVPYQAFQKKHIFWESAGPSKRRTKVEVSGPRVFNELARVGLECGFSYWITGSCATVAGRRALGNLVARRFLVDTLVRQGYYEADLLKPEE